MSTLYCGLDAGSTLCHLAAVNREGQKVANIGFPTGEYSLRQAFTEVEGDELKVHVEASDLTGWLRRVMLEEVPAVDDVIASHPKSLSWIGNDPLKGDPLDAWKLAELLRMGRTHEVYYSDDQNRVAFRKLVRHYEKINEQQARLKQKIGARFRKEGVLTSGSTLYTPRNRPDYLGRLDSPVVRRTVEHLYRCLDAALETREETLEMMQREARRYDEIGRFQEVPGIGFILACRFCAYIQNPHRFSNKRKLWRYCGLGLTDRSSDGKPLGRKRIDPNGHSGLKDLSNKGYMGAMRCKSDNAFKRAKRRYLQKGGHETGARLKIQRKVVTTLWTLWKKGVRYDDSKG